MARMFTGTDAVIFPGFSYDTGWPFAVSFWWWPTFAQNDGINHCVFQTLAHLGWGDLSASKLADGRLAVGNCYWGESRMFVAPTDYTLNQNAWNHIHFAVGGEAVYVNGEQVIHTGGGYYSLWTGYSLTIGNNLARTASASGAIAELMTWTDTGNQWRPQQVRAAYRGVTPEYIYYDGTGQYRGVSNRIPLWGIHDPEINVIGTLATSGVLYGAPKFGSNPPVKAFSDRWWRVAQATGAPFVPPPVNNASGTSELVIPDEGEVIAQQIIFGTAAPEDLWLRLYTNDYYPNELTTQTNFVEPDGYGYNPMTLAKNTDWEFTAGIPTPAIAASWPRTFNITGPVGNAYGYWVQGKASQKVYWAARFPAPVVIGASGGEVIVVPRITATSVT